MQLVIVPFDSIPGQSSNLVLPNYLSFCLHPFLCKAIGIQLNELQAQVNNLSSEPYPCTKSPKKVIELLMMKMQILFYEFDISVQYTLR